jgi:hypothetical protein
MQPAAVPPAAATLVTVLRRFPAGAFRPLPEALTVWIVSVVVPGVVVDTATLGLLKPPPTSNVGVADKSTVPVYPPVDVTVIVEVPLFPGDGDEIVTFVAETVMPGLVTVTVAFPEEPAYAESPPYAATMVSLPAVKPSAGVAELTARMAVPVPLAPAVTWAVPTVVVPMVKVTVPATVPPVVDWTVAVSVRDP